MTIPFGGFVSTGWRCPNCGAGNSPSLTQCPCAHVKTFTDSGSLTCAHVWVTDTTGTRCVWCGSVKEVANG